MKKDEKSTTDDATGADPKPGSTSAPARTPSRKEPSAIDREIDRWFHEQIHGSAVSRHTPSYNHLRQAVADLKARLASVKE